MTFMNQVLEEILRAGAVRASSGEAIELGIYHIPPGEGEFLQQLIADFKPKDCLEVGLAYGISSLFICEALKSVGARRHIIIDAHQSTFFQGIGLRNLQAAGYDDLVDFYESLSCHFLPQL